MGKYIIKQQRGREGTTQFYQFMAYKKLLFLSQCGHPPSQQWELRLNPQDLTIADVTVESPKQIRNAEPETTQILTFYTVPVTYSNQS